ncbi:thyrotropin-releasing hormone-degrading ectoenzyme-like [Ixodes scapularis]
MHAARACARTVLSTGYQQRRRKTKERITTLMQSHVLLEHLLEDQPRKPKGRFSYLKGLPFRMSESTAQTTTNSADHEIRNFVLFACLVSFVLLVSFFAVPSRQKTRSRPPSLPALSLYTGRVKGGDVSSQTDRMSPLPKNVVPRHYDLELDVSDLERAAAFTGRMNVVVECVEKATMTIVMHSMNLTVRDANISTFSGNQQISNVGVKTQQSEPDLEDLVVFDLGFELVSGTEYNLSVTFAGPYRSELLGLSVRNYTNEDGSVSNVLSSHLQYGKARLVFPCFDEPNLKATFNLSLLRRRGFESLSNWDVQNTLEIDSSLRRDTFELSPQISPSQLAFCVYNGFLVRYQGYSKLYSLKSDVTFLEMTLRSFLKMIKYMETLLNAPLPFRKYHLLSLPDVEQSISPSWGIVVFGTPMLAFDEDTQDWSRREEVLSRLAHVVAHQWFGNLVSPRRWDDIWVYEGLALIFQRIILDNVFGDQISESYRGRRVRDVLRSEDMKRLTTKPQKWLPTTCDHPLMRKAEIIMDVIMQIVSPRGFIESVSSFLNQSRFAATGVKDLLMTLRNQNSSSDFVEKIETWINHVGYPLLSVKRKVRRANTFVLSQTTMCYGATKCFNQTWRIPISYTIYKDTGENFTEKLWLTQHETQLQLNVSDSDVVLFNTRGWGYYRVNYDSLEWTKIIKLLSVPGILDSSTKVRVLDDVYQLSEAGVIPYSLFFDAVTKLRDEWEQNIWRTYFEITTDLDKMLVHSQLDKAWRNFNSDLLTSIVSRIIKAEEPSSRRFQKEILERACWYGQPQCIRVAKETLNAYLTENKTRTPTILPAGVSLCSGIRHGPVELWDMLWSKLFSSSITLGTAVSMDPILQGLSCTSNEGRLWKLLNETLVSSLLKKQQDFVLHCVAASGVARGVLLEFVLSNWNKVIGKTGSHNNGTWDAIFESVSRDAKTSREVNLLSSPQANATDSKVIGAALTSALERRKRYKRWHREHDADLFKALVT